MAQQTDRLTKAWNWATFAAVMACGLSLVTFIAIASPGFDVQKDRAEIQRMLNLDAVNAG